MAGVLWYECQGDSENAPGLDAEDVGNGLDGVHHEVDGTSFVCGEHIGASVIVDVERDVGGTV